MITEKKYKYMTIRPVLDSLQTHALVHSAGSKPELPTYRISNNRTGHPLGYIEWDAYVKEWAFLPQRFGEQTVFTSGCLEDIQDFIRMLSQDSK